MSPPVINNVDNIYQMLVNQFMQLQQQQDQHDEVGINNEVEIPKIDLTNPDINKIMELMGHFMKYQQTFINETKNMNTSQMFDHGMDFLTEQVIMSDSQKEEFKQVREVSKLLLSQILPPPPPPPLN